MGNKTYPLVSIISVNYNQSEITCLMLQSLQKVTYPNIEVIVVDNGSPKDNPKIISERFPNTILIESKKNLGFAGGNNLAIPVCKGEYLLFLNNDTEVEPGFIEPLVRLLQENPQIGMVSPRIQYFHTPQTLQFAGFTPISAITIRNAAIGFGEKDNGQYSYTCETGSIFGAAMLVPKKIIDEVGVMDPYFFLYYEEHDWAHRIQKAGFKIYYCGESLVLHKESISTVKNSYLQIFYINRNRILFSRRNNTGLTLLLSLLFLYVIAGTKGILLYLLKGEFKLAKAILDAEIWNIVNRKTIGSNKL